MTTLPCSLQSGKGYEKKTLRTAQRINCFISGHVGSRKRSGSNAKDPSEQPGTSAPELLPDREANVNVIAEGKALGPRAAP